jgi:pyrroloquinoline quinone biosynthesis protein B
MPRSLLCLALLLAACAPSEDVPEAPVGPYVLVLGTVQDGGLPHAACSGSNCMAARQDPKRRRLIASLAIVLPISKKVYLIDASPDIRAQLDHIAAIREGVVGRVDRAPVDGVFLTHAHMGHYLGLAFFGFEAVHTDQLPIYSTDQMGRYLLENGPWSQLAAFQNIQLNTMSPGDPVGLGEGVRVSAVAVPHRDEYTDTVGFLIEGPERSILYVPDTDSWQAWDPALTERLAGVDLALLDGSFYSTAELPGRSVDEIGHPLISDSMDLLEGLVASGEVEILFTHLNHSNPALDPESAEHEEVVRRGFAVLADGQRLAL